MKATIKGRVYDTNKATLIAKDNNGFCPMDERYMEERLYQKTDGEYFVYGYGGSMSPYGKREGTKMVGTVGMSPAPLEEAKWWARHHMSMDAYIKHFGALT